MKILVVDDEMRMRKLVRDFLVRQDYEVLEAADGEEALDVFYAEKNIPLCCNYIFLITAFPFPSFQQGLRFLRAGKYPSF